MFIKKVLEIKSIYLIYLHIFSYMYNVYIIILLTKYI